MIRAHIIERRYTIVFEADSVAIIAPTEDPTTIIFKFAGAPYGFDSYKIEFATAEARDAAYQEFLRELTNIASDHDDNRMADIFVLLDFTRNIYRIG